MKILSRVAAALLAVTSIGCGESRLPRAPTAVRRASAEELFASYVELEREFDARAAELYSDDAVLRNRRTYPGGHVREVEVGAAEYKRVIRMTMPLARMRGDYSTYSDVEFTPLGSNVRITATRYSVLKNYSSPISLLVGPGPDGQWTILEETSESRP